MLVYPSSVSVSGLLSTNKQSDVAKSRVAQRRATSTTVTKGSRYSPVSKGDVDPSCMPFSDAPPPKRQSRKPPSTYVPRRYKFGVRSQWKTSSQSEAGPSVPGGRMEATGTGVEQDRSVSTTRKRRNNISRTRNRNFVETDDCMQIINSDDELFLDETDSAPLQTTTASDEPASMGDYTTFENHILDAEDALNDLALRSIVPEKLYDFCWGEEKSGFKGRQETFTGIAGPTFDMSNQTTILDVFYKMIDIEFIDMLCTETNRYATSKIELLKAQNKVASDSPLHKWVPADWDEIISFLAVYILQDLIPLPEDRAYFKFNGFCTMPFFQSIMSYDRFILLQTLLHFANKETSDKKNKLWKINPVIEYFNKQFSTLYCPSKLIVFDESLLDHHGRLSMSQKIASKAAQGGVKTYELYEASSGYLWKFLVYAERARTDNKTDEIEDDVQVSEEPEYEASASDRLVSNRDTADNSDRPSTALVVYQLVQGLFHRGHTLIIDSLYNSPLLARCLKRKKTDCYGTLRLNREFVPESLKVLKKTDLSIGEVEVQFCSDLSMVVWRDRSLVCMLSTYHPLELEAANNNCKLKGEPSIVSEYNNKRGAVNRTDSEFLSAYPAERTQKHAWDKKLFRYLYDVAIFNCYVIFSTNNTNISQKRFKTLLAENLLKAHRRLDLTAMTIPTSGHTSKRTGSNKCTVVHDHFPIRVTPHQQCWLCAQRKGSSRTIWKCIQCQVSLCIDSCFRAYHKK